MKQLITFLLALLPFVSTAQCLTKHEGFDFAISPFTIKAVQISKSMQLTLIEPKFITEDDPTEFSSIGAVAVANFKASKWNGKWLDGTGPIGNSSTANWDNFYLVDMVPDVAEQIVWAQTVEVEPGVPYNFKVDMANIAEPGAISNAALPDVAVKVFDGRTQGVELGRWQLPEVLPAGSNTSGLEWVTYSANEIYFKPKMVMVSGTPKYYATITVVGYDAELLGSDFGIDNICLEAIDLADPTTELSANDHCEGEDLIANLLLSPTPTNINWWVDGVHMKDNLGNPITLSTLDIGTYSNLTGFRSGVHTVKVTYDDGNSSNDPDVLYQVFNVAESESSPTYLEYDIDRAGDQIVFDATHTGTSVKFFQYNHVDEMDADANADGLDDVDGLAVNGSELLPDANGDYITAISAMTLNNSYYFCKFVEHKCSSSQSKWSKDCAMICPDLTTPFSLSHNSTTYNPSTEQYDVSFNLVDPSPMQGLHWVYGDNTTEDYTGTFPIAGALTQNYSYSAPGYYEICVVGEWFEECVEETCIHLEVCESIASASLTDETICLGETPASLDADAGNVDVQGTTYNWLLNGVSVSTSKVYTPSISDFRRSGLYVVTLIKNNGCTTLTETANISVKEEMNFGINWASEESNGLNVKVSAARQRQTGETYTWYIDFGSGYVHQSSWDNLDFPGTYTFGTPGEYKIKLEIKTDNTADSCTWTSEKRICVAATPKDCCNCTP